MSSRPCQVVLVCEDTQQRVFVERFLKCRGWSHHDIRSCPLPQGQGAGEQWVREKLVQELETFHRKRHHTRHGLVAAVDADVLTCGERLSQLKQACEEAGLGFPGPDEGILVVIPRRSIETWLAYLDGENVDEQKPYPRRLRGHERNCQAHVDRLVGMCDAGQLRQPAPPSLESACEDWARFAATLRP